MALGRLALLRDEDGSGAMIFPVTFIDACQALSSPLWLSAAGAIRPASRRILILTGISLAPADVSTSIDAIFQCYAAQSFRRRYFCSIASILLEAFLRGSFAITAGALAAVMLVT